VVGKPMPLIGFCFSCQLLSYWIAPLICGVFGGPGARQCGGVVFEESRERMRCCC
jgi:hypothetical protein